MKCWLADFLQVHFVELEDPPLIAALGRGRAATTNTCQIEGGYWFEAGHGQQRVIVFLQLQNEVEQQYVQYADF